MSSSSRCSAIDAGRRGLLLTAALLPWPALGQAVPPPELSGWRLHGQARMTYFGFAVYQIGLWARGESPVDVQNWHRQPLALALRYQRGLRGADIARRSLVEMRRQAEIDEAKAQRWLADMEQAFPDVKDGDRLSGILEPGQGLRFFFNGQLRREIADVEFARLFIGIWLSPQSSEPALRRDLLGRP